MNETFTWENSSKYERDWFMRTAFESNVLDPSTSVDDALKLIPTDWEIQLTKFPGFPVDPWEAIVSVPTKCGSFRSVSQTPSDAICRALLMAKGYDVE